MARTRRPCLVPLILPSDSALRSEFEALLAPDDFVPHLFVFCPLRSKMFVGSRHHERLDPWQNVWHKSSTPWVDDIFYIKTLCMGQ
jgi:hypothetical protein